MKYVYKTVSVDEFIRGGGRLGGDGGHGKEKAIGIGQAIFGNEVEFAKNMSELLNYLLNYYADDGWEYWQTAEFSANAMKTTGARAVSALVVGNISGGSPLNPDGRKYPIIIFRKSISDEEFDLRKEERAKEYKERWEVKTEPQLSSEELDAEAANYEISFNGEKYCFKEYKYDKLSDAIAYAKKNS